MTVSLFHVRIDEHIQMQHRPGGEGVTQKSVTAMTFIIYLKMKVAGFSKICTLLTNYTT
jgi:hypothetical protein